jgi:hypothetical protein
MDRTRTTSSFAIWSTSRSTAGRRVATGTLHDPHTGNRIGLQQGQGTCDDVQIDHGPTLVRLAGWRAVASAYALDWGRGGPTLRRSTRCSRAAAPRLINRNSQAFTCDLLLSSHHTERNTVNTHRPQPQPHHHNYGQHQPPYVPQYGPPAPAKKSRRWPWIAGIAVAFVFGNISGNAADSSPAPSPTASNASAPAVQPAGPLTNAESAASPETSSEITVGTIPNGSWMVPSEVAPGQYRSTGVEEGLIEYCQITTYDAGGDVLEWKNVGDAGAPLLVTVSSKAVTVTNSGCATFTKVG